MYFRPLPILSLFAAPVLAALIALGVWQAQRAAWKSGLVRDFEQAAAAAPLTLDRVCSAGLAEGQVIAPPAAAGRSLRLFGNDASGTPGWRLFQAAEICGSQVLMESGFEALVIGGPGGQLPAGARAKPVIDRYIVEPWPEKSALAPANAPERNEWHWFDDAAIGEALEATRFDATFIVTPYAGMPAFLSRTPPATHIGYAVTWFGMAAAFLVIYAVFHARAGRLRFGRAGG